MHLSTTVVIILATLIFTIVCFKRRDLFSWLSAYIASTLSEIFRLLSQAQYDAFEVISIAFSALTVLLFIIAVSYEYYQTFSKSNKTIVMPTVLLAISQQITSLILQVTIGFLLFIAMFLILRIYLKKRTPTHAFMCFILITGLMQLIASIFRDIGFPGANQFLEFSRVVMATMMLITGIVAIIEEKIIKSENKYRLAYNRAEFYKDLFVHDINNILQNLEFSLEIISQEVNNDKSQEKVKELINLAKNQVNRGANLGLNVKKLSDLEGGRIKNKKIHISQILDDVISHMVSKFPEKELNIRIEPTQTSFYAVANELVEDIFRILLNNAIRYNDNPIKEVLVKISKELIEKSSYIKIEFIDNGIGIPDAMKQSILQHNYKNPKSFKRVGLGLLLVNEVMESYKGKIWIEDKVKGDSSKGSNVIVLIPEA
jgi:signal transduction histidine kinase